jgi:hypothetical protein
MNKSAPRRLRLSCLLAALTALLFAAPRGARAQVGLYGQFSAAHFNSLPDTNTWGYGAGFGLYGDAVRRGPLRVGGDVRLQWIRPADNTTLFSFLVGPRVDFRPRPIPLNPYAEFLFGAGHFSYGNNSPSTTQFDWRALGGVDKTILPRLDWRVIEVSYGQLNTYSGHLHPVTLSTGIVLRLR